MNINTLIPALAAEQVGVVLKKNDLYNEEVVATICADVLGNISRELSRRNLINDYRMPQQASIFSAEMARVLNILSNITSAETLNNYISRGTATSTLEVLPEYYKCELDEIENRRGQGVKIKTSKQYYCAKCGKNETTIREYQGRASDEASNFAIQCINCGHRWRK